MGRSYTFNHYHISVGALLAAPRTPALENKIKNHRRKSIRVKGYDYSQPGAYFITICLKNKEFLLGKIIDGEMQINKAGQVVIECWQNLKSRYPDMELDAFVIMPNHIHGIINIIGAGVDSRRMGAASSAPTLGRIVRAFKSISAIKTNRILSRSGQPLWQRNYYEHVIRDEESLNRIREYIMNNPLRWSIDRENPERKGEDEFDKWLETYKSRPDENK